MKKLLIIPAVALCAASLTAQTLSKEIVVDKDIVPEQRAAQRLNINPAVVAPTIYDAPLMPTDRAVATEVPTMIDRLEPAITGAADSLTIKQRGYAVLGYFPIFNVGASAGYRIIDNNTTLLNVWGQYDGLSYKRDDIAGINRAWDRNTVTLGAGFAHEFSAKSTLQAGAHYTFAATGRPWDETLATQRVNRFDVSLGYAGTISSIAYNIGARFGYTDFAKAEGDWLAALDPLTELDFGVDGAASFKLGRDGALGLRFDLGFNRYSQFNTYGFIPTQGFIASQGDAEVIGAIKLNPYWVTPLFKDMRVELGLNLDFSINSGAVVNVSPACALSWTPTGSLNCIAMQVKATGGLRANTFSSLLDVTPYVASSIAYGNSRVPYDLQAVITVGPFVGGYLELSGIYAAARDWLMPAVINGQNLWRPVDMKGWLLSAKIGYAFRDLVEVSATYSHSGSEGYYQWRDRAKQALRSEVTVRPIRPLDINVGFESRWGRKVPTYTYAPLLDRDVEQAGERSLGVTNNLSAEALYRITRQWSVFARCENILNSSGMLIYGIPSQGITGLIGAAYRF